MVGMNTRQRSLGSLTTPPMGLGCMGMTAFYGPADEAEAIDTIHRALDVGCNLFDTAEVYGPYTNEELLGKALAGRRDEAIIATKFGILFGDEETLSDPRLDATPANVRRSIDGSLRRLGTDHVDLYFLHRVDPDVPIEETIGTMAELVEAGKVLHLGVSEASAESIRRAHAVHPIAALQTEYSLWARDIETEIIPTCRQLGIGINPYAPLGRGFLSGRFSSLDELDPNDFRRQGPRYQGTNLAHNLQLAATVRRLADEFGCTPAQLTLAWTLSQGDDVVPIPGTKRRRYLVENWAAREIDLTVEDLARVDDELPATAGDRYDSAGMASVDG